MSVESYVTIGALEHGKIYEQIFFIASFEPGLGRTVDGLPFARVTCRDSTGEIEGVIWGNPGTRCLDYTKGWLSEQEAPVVEQGVQQTWPSNVGEYYTIRAEVKLHGGNLEFQAQAADIVAVETPLNCFDYIKGVADSVLTSYAAETEDHIMSVDDPVYRDILGNAVHRLGLLKALREAPYGVTGAMAYRGGLLVHVAHSMRLSMVAVQQAKEQEIPFSPSLVTAGCALRNIGWHTATRFQGDHLRPRDAYYMGGIYRASARYIDHLILTCEGDLEIQISEQKRQALENMCNKRSEIKTVEGMMVSHADSMADMLDSSVATLQRKQTGSWTNELFTGHL